MRINKKKDEMLLDIEKKMHFKTDLLNISIADDGKFYDLKEIISELENLRHQSSTQAMSDHALFLQGKREMLSDIIKYLKKITK